VTWAALLSACDRPASANERGALRADSYDPRKRPGYIVDSIFAPEEALRRFRIGLDSVASLDGPTRRDELVQRFFAALRRKDRAALSALAIDRAEFAYLVFPQSRWSRAPYRQPPDVAWMLFQAKSEGSLTKLLGRADRFELAGYRCRDTETDGPMRLWAGCVVRVRETGGGRARDLRLFGTIIERDGHYKFAGFANDL
jgi:ketosteroid isomerase-like protein